MTKETKKVLAIIQNIRKNVDKKAEVCLFPFCNYGAINSHLLQKNGILTEVAENSHLMQIKFSDFFKIEKEGLLIFKRLGINQAISYPLFCNLHDTTFFKCIEIAPIDFFDYKVQLLFAYRAMCAEIRKKEKNAELDNRILNANSLSGVVSNEFLKLIKAQKIGNEMGISDLHFFKEEFEREFESPESRFTFKTFSFPIVKISISAVFSYDRKDIRNISELKAPLNTVFVNVIPQDGNLFVIVGYHNTKHDTWILDYLSRWEKCNSSNYTLMLTDLTTRIESWVLAESLYKKISTSDLAKYKENFMEYVDNSTRQYFFEVDLFRNIV